ncbi:MAG: hypothetical protein QOG09_432 [Solirubrobacterales bacterium]|jgi:UDP-N-acetylglucosamine transferase subunit ALG13|nr:hypothetical protein [Solirubrobacterales bacterium]
MSQDDSFVFFTVGTDHHRFDRLVDWAERWTQQAESIRCVIQYGTARPPRHGEAYESLDYPRFERFMAAATIAVTQGGPGSIASARRAGKRPLVVPRKSGLEEHLNDHQVAFAEHLANLGMIELVRSEDDLYAMLSRAREDPSWLAIDDAQDSGVNDTVAAFAKLVDPLISPAPRGL